MRQVLRNTLLVSRFPMVQGAAQKNQGQKGPRYGLTCCLLSEYFELQVTVSPPDPRRRLDQLQGASKERTRCATAQLGLAAPVLCKGTRSWLAAKAVVKKKSGRLICLTCDNNEKQA